MPLTVVISVLLEMGEMLLALVIGAFAGVWIRTTWQEWRHEPSVSGRGCMVALSSVAVVLSLALFVDAIRRMVGSLAAAGQYVLAIVAIVAACVVCAYLAVTVTDHPWAVGKPIRVGTLLGFLTFTVVSVAWIPGVLIALANGSTVLVALRVTEAMSLAIGGIIGGTAGALPKLRQEQRPR